MALRYLTAGESHGPALIAILEGMPAGLLIPPDVINRQLARRQTGFGSGPRMRLEKDEAHILSGLMNGETIGSPIAIFIKNLNHEKWRNKDITAFTIPRPGHVDLAAAIKYGYKDLRPGLERSSARETAARVAVGALCSFLLSQFNILIGGYVLSIGDVTADVKSIDYHSRFEMAESNDLRCPDSHAIEAMKKQIDDCIEAKDTLGGTIEIVVSGVPAGLGTHVQWDRRIDTRLAAAVMSVQAIKGLEIGNAFENCKMKGSQVHDAIRLDGDKIVRETNQAGGIEGGITNGQPIVIRAAMKPIASTLMQQKSVDLAQGIETGTNYERSDYCPVPRAVPVLESVIAYVLADALLEKLGGDSMQELKSRYDNLRKACLSDLRMDANEKKFWCNTIQL